ncbi:hypothetical protein QR680_006385 [Steinernema hermaphroditum]|uniref:Serine/threonine-protein phosphatase n=1 Tax=Steinernema hermaphroditum TaxID=289476 RepID=A0AA39HXM7_9BILA|nr:hypothetical protein QR680_006385 [Steinernema hermaphroditum]
MMDKENGFLGANEVNDLIIRLLSVGQPEKQLTKTVTESELILLSLTAREVFKSQPVFLELNGPLKVCGDTHGQYTDLLRIFDKGGFPPLSNYLFLGDYVDRGKQNLENICLLLCYKIKYPQNFFLLRGNHECSLVNRHYGFYEECTRRYRSGQKVWLSFQDTFEQMPLAALIGERILCMHGGISPHLKSINQLREIPRPPDVMSSGLPTDLLWADPISDSGFQNGARGTSFGFGADVLAQTMKMLDIDLVARAHQVVQDGYEFFGNRKLVTVFSAPHYCGQFDNAAAIMAVSEELGCSFLILRAVIGVGVRMTRI